MDDRLPGTALGRFHPPSPDRMLRQTLMAMEDNNNNIFILYSAKSICSSKRFTFKSDDIEDGGNPEGQGSFEHMFIYPCSYVLQQFLSVQSQNVPV